MGKPGSIEAKQWDVLKTRFKEGLNLDLSLTCYRVTAWKAYVKAYQSGGREIEMATTQVLAAQLASGLTCLPSRRLLDAAGYV